MVSNISEEHITSTFTSTLKMKAICASKTFVTTYKITWHHNPEDHSDILTAART
jgi:hypothetical protein